MGEAFLVVVVVVIIIIIIISPKIPLKFNGLFGVIDIYSKNTIISRNNGKGQVYRKNK